MAWWRKGSPDTGIRNEPVSYCAINSPRQRRPLSQAFQSEVVSSSLGPSIQAQQTFRTSAKGSERRQNSETTSITAVKHSGFILKFTLATLSHVLWTIDEINVDTSVVQTKR